MRLFLRTVLEFLWHRDAEYAACVVIAVSRWMDGRNLEQMEDYLRAVREYER